MEWLKIVCAVGLCVLLVSCQGASEAENTPGSQEPLEIKGETMADVDLTRIPFETITGDTTSLSDFAGKVVLIVNVASKCGNTPQYEGLEKLYRQFADSGLVVIGFPANNFGGQEPGTNKEILQFCTSTYDVTFPMMAKVSVKGDDEHPLFAAMTQKSSLPGDITWNFSKFLIDRKGHLVARFGPKVQPLSQEIVDKVEAVL